MEEFDELQTCPIFKLFKCFEPELVNISVDLQSFFFGVCPPMPTSSVKYSLSPIPSNFVLKMVLSDVIKVASSRCSEICIVFYDYISCTKQIW